MRVVLLTQIVPVVEGYTEVVTALGHEVPAVIVGRPFHQPPEAFIAAAGKADVVFAASKHSIAPLLRAYEADVGLCTGLPVARHPGGDRHAAARHRERPSDDAPEGSGAASVGLGDPHR